MKKDKTIPPYMDYEIKQEMPICWVQENEDEYKIIIAEDFELKENNGKWFAVRKKPQYPKTYVECAKILDCFGAVHIDGYKNELLEKFQELIICRDAYWKIAGEQIGFGKPWKPDWNDDYQDKWIINFYRDDVNLTDAENVHFVLAFPTEEMRDAFYENFKDLIEQCKELL